MATPGFTKMKYDGYRMHARLDRGDARLLTRTGLDWTAKYPATAEALTKLPTEMAYLDGDSAALGLTASHHSV